MDEQYDLVVIGGGVIGLSCILHILDAAPDLRVALMDLPGKPGISSKAAGGFLAPYCEFDEDTPLFELARESYDYFPRFLTHFGLDRRDSPIVDAAGILVPVNDYEIGRSQRIAEHASNYVEVKTLEARELLSAEPHLNTEACKAAYLLPGAMIDSLMLYQRLYESCRRKGIAVIDVPIQRAAMSEGRIEMLTLENGATIRGAHFLMASGVWSRTFAAMLGLELELTPVKGHVARFQIADGFLNHVLHTHEVAMGPRRGQGIIIGATEEYVGFDARVDDDRVAHLCNAASRYVPALWNQELAETWIGFRPKLADGNPAIGWSSKIENLLIATGHFRNGILLTPITGKTIAHCFKHREAANHTAFQPGRLGV